MMVFTGKPSSACDTCKTRRIKCDNIFPACSPCIKAGYTCPGPKSEFDSNLRDQTALVSEREQRRAQKLRTEESSSGTNTPHTRRSQAASPASFGSTTNASRSRSPRDSIEQQAALNLFSTYVLVPRHPETQSILMDGLSSLYPATNPDSLLIIATNAVGFGIQGASRSHIQKKQQGQKYYNQALAISHDIMQNSSTGDTDETLMAILLLGFYERVTGLVEETEGLSKHIESALSLIRRRGKDKFQTEASRRLLLATENIVISDSIRYSRFVSMFSTEWPDVQQMAQQHASYRLTTISAPISDLRAKWKIVSRLTDSPETRNTWIQILHHAMDVDRTLAIWARSIPETWNPVELSIETVPESIKQIGAYQDRVDMYLDLWIAHAQNSCRTSRIFVQNIILHCIDLLDDGTDEQYRDDRFVALQRIQQMADEICASIPFHMDSKISFGADMSGLEFPQVEGKPIPEDQIRLASGLGAWFALEPLSILLEQPTISAEQKMWVGGQIRRISWMYAIRMPSPLGPVMKASLVDPPDINR